MYLSLVALNIGLDFAISDKSNLSWVSYLGSVRLDTDFNSGGKIRNPNCGCGNGLTEAKVVKVGLVEKFNL